MSTDTAQSVPRLPNRLPESVGMLALASLALLTYAGGLALATPIQNLEGQQFAAKSDPANAVMMFGYILAVTAVVYAAIKLDFDLAGRFPALREIALAIVKLAVYGVIGLWLFVASGLLLPTSWILLAPALSFGLAVALAVWPRWYVKNAVAVGVGALAIASWGTEFALLPALVLLVLLLVYDVIAVYVTGHMKTLANGLLDSTIHLPAILVIPLQLSGREDEQDSDQRTRVALGTGDIIIPGILVVSAGAYAPAPTLSGAAGVLNLPALTTIAGILAGYLGLHRMLGRGGSHAGLPWLNGGAITGYLAGALAAGIPLPVALGLQASGVLAI
jgi:presenilin-like A22 family membrane protease